MGLGQTSVLGFEGTKAALDHVLDYWGLGKAWAPGSCSKCSRTETQHHRAAALSKDDPDRCTGTWTWGQRETREGKHFLVFGVADTHNKVAQFGEMLMQFTLPVGKNAGRR